MALVGMGIAAARVQQRDCHDSVVARGKECIVVARGKECRSLKARRSDEEYMRESIELAKSAIGKTSPNPMVGCIIVKDDGEIVGRGFHPKAGQPHAEVFALAEAGERAEGATAYVTLEPCNHFGRTPPCSQAIVRAKLRRVVVGMVDPNPLVAGKGLQTLKKAGIEVVAGVEDELCRNVNEFFIHFITTKRPFVCIRFSMSLDGCLIAESSVPESGNKYSRLLQEYDAVVVTDAAVAHNPTILSAEDGAKQPLRIVFAKSLKKMNINADIFETSLAPTLVVIDAKALVEDVQAVRKVDGKSMEALLKERGVQVMKVEEFRLDSVMDVCYQKGLSSLLIECGGDAENILVKKAVEEGIPQKLTITLKPVIIGKNSSNNNSSGLCFDERINLQKLTTTKCGDDVTVDGYFAVN